MFNFVNQVLGGAGDMLGGAFKIVTSPFALIKDIFGGFGSQETNQFMSAGGGACCCGGGSYGPSGDYSRDGMQDARISQLERRVAYDEAMVSHRLARRW